MPKRGRKSSPHQGVATVAGVASSFARAPAELVDLVCSRPVQLTYALVSGAITNDHRRSVHARGEPEGEQSVTGKNLPARPVHIAATESRD